MSIPRPSADRAFASTLPSIEAVDELAPEALVDLLTQLGALTERARARLALLAVQPREAGGLSKDRDESMTAKEVAALLNAKPPWVYRHRRLLGGEKLDGLVRFSRRRVFAYVERQRRL